MTVRGPSRARRLAAALVAATAVIDAAPSAAESADPRLAAFRAACFPERQDIDGVVRTALAEGWREVPPTVDPEFAAVMGKAEAAMKGSDLPIAAKMFAKEVAGAPVYLVATRVPTDTIDLVGCYLYDFAATKAFDSAALAELFGEAPANAHNDPELLVAEGWNLIAAWPGVMDAYAAFIPDGSIVERQTGFTGAMVKVSTVDPKEE